ncbi:FecR family protein [Dyadobacter fermentans]|uniref:Anti-FecI sigma factor, FecR n=1 Tax=Dyadobacter fermentans (strain ATCC 700827 / DSM 18053 / CIP 107007 / KCTC 52180 / NS114) TaxID=471854 RepID=C6VZL0_DYAFD|nr:FecR family protein [Dyadobacter fermentans]ACT93488.1 anti-FecI sigma factor, FecR [Dyadobacter fermentans DSM 18053]
MIKNIKGFLRLLDRYQRNLAGPEEKKTMDMWYDSIDYTAENHHVADEHEADKAMWSTISSRMDQPSEAEHRLPARAWVRNFYFRLAAACVLFVLGLIGYRFAFDDAEQIAGVKNELIEHMSQVTNKGTDRKRFTLPDGSRVTLEPGATLYYPAEFAQNQRDVFLKGDVFFDIAHDKSRPFYVHANNIVTKVLGTSFTIRENKSTNAIEVAVMTGVVEVKQVDTEPRAEQQEQKVVLTQNKKATFYPEEEKLVTGLVEQPKVILEKSGQMPKIVFNYIEKPLPDIVKVLEEAYGVKIAIGNENLRNCIITADLSQESTLFNQLEILCESIDAHYQLSNDQVTVSGKGCEPTK